MKNLTPKHAPNISQLIAHIYSRREEFRNKRKLKSNIQLSHLKLTLKLCTFTHKINVKINYFSKI